MISSEYVNIKPSVMLLSMPSRLVSSEELISRDPKYLFTLVSYVLAPTIYINLHTFKSPALAIAIFVLYFLINGTFLAYAFFHKETPFFRLTLGVLLQIMLIGVVGWLIMIIQNLDAINLTLALLIVTTLSSLLNRRMKHKNAT
jgi:hypothetical protein